MSTTAAWHTVAPTSCELKALEGWRLQWQPPVHELDLRKASNFHLTHETASVLLGFPALQVLKLALHRAHDAHETQDCLQRLSWCVSSPWRELELTRWRHADVSEPECLFQLPRLEVLRLVEMGADDAQKLRVPKGWRAHTTMQNEGTFTLECTRDGGASGAPSFVLER